jgi:hypothetical protein
MCYPLFGLPSTFLWHIRVEGPTKTICNDGSSHFRRELLQKCESLGLILESESKHRCLYMLEEENARWISQALENNNLHSVMGK